ncbi:hypothetical protein M438DRAFT_179987 [Aureobasidium pullulans EXF-150]|uniref:Uncharacterized protein n=1 Tax=Aureobasidium pullulans EXF-150 TaxID=1043002 RepID=A0A074XSP7_AURPU|nr:uncharacterized protein M438DRAFT_179987 [Aureobasidium pullulans EXF-150]KEQ86639.1 hypothetical protein M438DRAFT_179987 [Aureobasidium pullulans EXF-150]
MRKYSPLSNLTIHSSRRVGGRMCFLSLAVFSFSRAASSSPAMFFSNRLFLHLIGMVDLKVFKALTNVGDTTEHKMLTESWRKPRASAGADLART